MQIVLSILHFLGWALLAIVGILIVALLIVLFHPVRYLINIHWLDERWAKFQIHWFFRLIRAKISYGDELVYGEFHLFWKKITFSFDLTEKQSNEPSENVEIFTENEEKTQESSKNIDTLSDNVETAEEQEETSDKSIISKIKGMIERIKEAYPKIKKIVTDEKNKEAVIHLKKEFIYLLKVFLPKKSKIDVVFSSGSPDTTGQAFGILACFPAMYQKNWHIIPDFESDDLYIKGTIWGKGRIYGCEIVEIILRILFDKNCRRMYTMINRFLKWMKKEDNKAEGNVNG